MENNDILIRLRYALDIKDTEMAEIFKLGGVEVTKADVQNILKKTNEEDEDDRKNINDRMMESFLNGFIIFKRGKQDTKPGQPESDAPSIKESVNNMLLKKTKIALALTSEDMLEVFSNAGITVTKGELGALLRKRDRRIIKSAGINLHGIS